MYKNLEVLDKQNHKDMGFDNISELEVSKSLGYVPVGANEVLDMSAFAPVLITKIEDGEFAAFTGINNELNIYDKAGSYIPMLALSYPFINITVRNQDNNLNDVIGIDNSEFVGEKKANDIFNKSQELEELAQNKISIVRELNRQRDISKKIVSELKEHDLLEKKDFRVNIDGEEKVLLKEFYVINRDKLAKLDDAVLAQWARKGWMGVFDAHFNSLSKFQKVLQK